MSAGWRSDGRGAQGTASCLDAQGLRRADEGGVCAMGAAPRARISFPSPALHVHGHKTVWRCRGASECHPCLYGRFVPFPAPCAICMMDFDGVFQCLCVWVGAVDTSEDSMESSEEMVTPRAAASEADEEERKAGAAEVPVERAVEAREEVIVDALPPETAGQEREGKVDAAVQESVVQQPEAHEVEVPEVKREEAKG